MSAIRKAFSTERSTLWHGDCADVASVIAPESIDAIVTDPPAGISFMGKAWDGDKGGRDQWIAWLRDVMRTAMGLLKPGGHALVWALPRTSHWTATAIEDAGFEIRDVVIHLFGTGFPKSLDVSEAIDAAAGADRPKVMVPTKPGNRPEQAGPVALGATGMTDVSAPATPDAARFAGVGTALKPGHEAWILARKPLAGTVAANAIAYGTGGLRIDDCRIGESKRVPGSVSTNNSLGWSTGSPDNDGKNPNVGRFPANVTLDEWHDPVLRLRNNVSSEVARVIGVYLGQLQDVPCGDLDIPESGDPQEVLRSSVLRDVAVEGAEWRGAPELRTEAQRGVAGVDEKNQSSKRGDGSEASRMEGRALPDEGLPHRHDERGGNGDVRVDGEGGRLRSAAPTRDGEEAQASVASVRGGASPQRHQDGQSAAKSGTVGPRNTQAGPPGDREGTALGASGDRAAAIEACESSIPRGWMTYFEDTGRSVRKGAAAMLDEQSGSLQSGGRSGVSYDTGYVTGVASEWTIGGGGSGRCIADTGGASRFFYVAKAPRAEKDAGLDHLPLRTGGDATDGGNGGVRNHHPTVKSIALMRWLCRLITPPGGIVLDMFAGSGTTGLAALAEGLRFVGVEREAEFVDIAAGRLAHVECVAVPEMAQGDAAKSEPLQPSLFGSIGGAR